MRRLMTFSRSIRRALAGLALLLPAAASAQPVPQPVPNSRVVLTLPEGFQPSSLFAGFADDAIETSIVVVDMPEDAIDQLTSGLTVESLAQKGFQDPVAGTLDRDDDHLYFRATQVTGEEVYAKFLLMIHDEAGLSLVTANVPQRLIAAGKVDPAAIEAILASASFASAPAEPSAPLFAAGHLGPFKEAMTLMGQTKLYTLDGEPQQPSTGAGTVLIVAPSLDERPVGDLEAFAAKALGDMHGLAGIVREGAAETTLDGRSAFETLASATDRVTGAPLVVFQSVGRRDRGGYLRVVLIAPAGERERYLAEFRAIIGGIRMLR